MIWGRSIQASLATARKKYMKGQGKPDKETNLIPKDVFEALVKVDLTPQKKFIQVVCKWLVDYILNHVDGNYKVTLTPHPSGGGLHVDHIYPYGSVEAYSINLKDLRDTLELALELESKHVKLKDPMSFQTWSAYGNYLKDLDLELSKTDTAKLKRWNEEVDKAAKRPDNHSWVSSKSTVFKLMSYEQTHDICDHLYKFSAFDAFPHWCVAHTESYWNEYHENGSCFYLIASKEKTEYFMCEVHSPIRVTVWVEDGDSQPHDESLQTLESLGLKISDLPRFQAEYHENTDTQEVEIFYVYRKDLDWSGWGVDFRWIWLDDEALDGVMRGLADSLDKDPDLEHLRDRADYSFEVGLDSSAGNYDSFLDDLSHNYEADIEVAEEHTLADISRREVYLEKIWYNYLENLFKNESTGFRFSTRWMEALGIKWNYDRYNLKALEDYLVDAFWRVGRIKAHFQIQDNPHESVFEIVEPELENFSMTAFDNYKEYSEAFRHLLEAAIIRNHSYKEVPEDDIWDTLFDLIRIWVDSQERKK